MEGRSVMVPSALPAFEIPTGLMATGLHNLRGFGRGLRSLGSTNVGPLAQAFFDGQVNPSFEPTQYFQPAYMAPGQESALPDYLYMDNGSAQQIASLLGGSVVQAPPPGNYQGTNIPPANWIQLADGLFLPGNAFPPGVILSYPDECAAENALVSEIPGGVLSSTCAGGGTGTTPTQLAVNNGATNPGNSIVGYTPPPPVVTATPIVTSTPVTVAQPANTSVAFTAADTCSSVVAKIAALQSAGQSNVAIWSQIPSALAMCSTVEALNPGANIYDTASGYTGTSNQPGAVSNAGGQQQQQPSNAGSSTTDNTGLYLGIAAVIVALIAFK